MSVIVPDQHKLCTKCKEVKPYSAFSKSSRNKSGLRSECKECVHKHYTENKESILARCKDYVENNKEKTTQYQKEYRESHKEEIRTQQAGYREKNKDKKKEQDRLYRKNNLEKVRKAKNKYRNNNLERNREYQYKYLMKNLEKERERKRLYNKNNPDKRRVIKNRRRAREYNAEGFYTTEDMRRIYEQQQGLCYYCKEQLEWGKRHEEHKIPLSRGGTNWPENMAASCVSCNLSKNNKTDEEFFAYLEKMKGLT